MPTVFDEIFVPLAQKLIDETFGFSATHRRETRTYDADTGQNTVSTTDSTVSITPPSPYRQNRINGTTILEGDQWIKMSTRSGVEPEINDKFVIGSVIWQVVRVDPIVSGEQIAAYTLQLRR